MRLWARFLVLMTLTFIAGCSTSTNYRSSVVEFSHSVKKETVKPPQVPILSLPLRVGIAFVPETIQHQNHGGSTSLSSSSGLSEKDKMSLMQDIGEHFKKQEFVKSIVRIPSSYVPTMGSFDSLDRLKRKFGVDVLVLISFDQRQQVDSGFWAISYLTVIGAFIVPGQKTDTHTILNAICYHIPSGKTIFSASGSSDIRSRSTPFNMAAQAREDSIKGFYEANKNLAPSLDQQMDLFKSMICQPEGDYQIVCEPGYKGVGSVSKEVVSSVEPFKADSVLVKKAERRLYLKKGDQIFKEYKISLGANPIGHKIGEGDKRTPEGTYILDWRKTNSRFYKSIHISYPNKDDILSAKSKGLKPGGMIMIHGVPNGFSWTKSYFRNNDWTNGCIAVSNADMDEIWAYVADGTTIVIQP